MLGAIVYLVLSATLLAPTDAHGARVEQLAIESAAVGRELEVNVVVPAARRAARRATAARLPARARRLGGHLRGQRGDLRAVVAVARRFYAAGGHSAALWFAAGETAPGAFDGPADFARNDVVCG